MGQLATLHTCHRRALRVPQMVKIITLPDGLVRGTLDRWVKTFNEVRDEPKLSLCLPESQKSFYEPCGIALLASQIADRNARGLDTVIGAAGDVFPETLFEFLQRMDFFDALDIEVPAEFLRTPRGPDHVPLRRIDSEAAAKKVARDTSDYIGADLASSIEAKVELVLREIGNNIVHHADTPGTGFGMAASSPKRKTFQMAFCDSGIGMLASMRSHPEFSTRITSDSGAIELAMELGVTSKDHSRDHGGFGLAELQDLCRKCEGRLDVFSGSAQWTLDASKLGASPTVAFVTHRSGTLVVLDGKSEF